MIGITRVAVLTLPLVALLGCSNQPSDKLADKSAAKSTPAAASSGQASSVTRRAGASAPGAVAKPARPENYDVRASGTTGRAATSLRTPGIEWLARAVPAAAAQAKASGSRDPVAAARAYLGIGGGPSLAKAAAAGPVDEAVVAGVHDLGRGPVIVQFKRLVSGLEVFGEKTAVAMTRNLDLVARTGNVAKATRAAPALKPFTLSGYAAIAAALSDLTGDVYAAGDLVAAPSKTADLRAGLADATATARGAGFAYPARARKLLFPLAGDLLPAYRVEVAVRRAGSPLLAYAYVVSAVDGAVLMRRDQVQSETFSYRVWAAPGDAATDPYLPYDGPAGLAGTPYPTATPSGFQPEALSQNAVSIEDLAHGDAHDPWLAPDATETVGNNVDAYADISGADGFDASDFRATTTGVRTFSYPYGFAAEPDATKAQVSAAITQLFYDDNFFHDWYYDAGFDEAAGNAQQNNLGRGGEEGDVLHAEAQDWGGTNNANMMTPGDGLSPRMQMYLFSGNGPCNVQVTAPAEALYEAAPADFGPREFDVTGPVVAATPARGCTALTNAAAVSGKIALIDRGDCSFKVKVAAAQAAGAAGVIIRSTPTSGQSFGMGDDDTVTTVITIPSQLLRTPDGVALGDALVPATTARLFRPHAQRRDGTIDNLIVAHEWGHFISNRLIGDGAGLESQQAGGLGEGWGDTHALLLSVREADAAVLANAGWNGTYGLSGWVEGGVDSLGAPNQGYYFGVRRVPYSTDMQKDPLTFRHIANGEALVLAGSTIPISFGADGADNAEVHDTGEVWATMLWECYAALLRDTQATPPRRTFDQARTQWKDYLVAAYKLTPLNPTLLEARDALLAAAYANDQRDYQLFWQAFAKRGAGVGAVGPDKWFSPDNTPVVESYEANPHLTLVGATFAASATSCSDGDGYLDVGEQGILHLTLKNDGVTPLPAVTASLSADTPSLTFPGGAVSLPAIDRAATVTIDVPVALSPRTGPAQAVLTLTFPAASVLAGATATLPLILDRDEALATSASDGFDTLAPTLWTTSGTVDGTPGGAPGWTQLPGSWWGADLGHKSDLSLVSPPLPVGQGDFTISFRHRHGFEGYLTGNGTPVGYDTGLLELSDDGGDTWNDIGGDVYDGYLIAGDPVKVIGIGFIFQSEGYPGFTTSELNLGTAYKGKTVRIRFRILSDELTGSDGWTIQNVSFGGLTTTPFPTLHLDAGKCAKSSTGSTGGGCATGPGSVNWAVLLLAGAALALRLPRRKRTL